MSELFLIFLLTIPFTFSRKLSKTKLDIIENDGEQQFDLGDCKISGCDDANYLLFSIDLPAVDSCINKIPTEITTISISTKMGSWFDAQSFCIESGYEPFDQLDGSVYKTLHAETYNLPGCGGERYWTGFHVLSEMQNDKTNVEIRSINRLPGYVTKAAAKVIVNKDYHRSLEGGMYASCFQILGNYNLDCQNCLYPRKSFCQGVYKA